jgi:putative transposase
MDFVSDQLYDGHRFSDQVADVRDLPPIIICNNGPELTSKAMFFWAREKSVKLGFIQPGKPTLNAFIESLNGKSRNECLNQHWFKSFEDARNEIDKWREHYNTVRRYSSLGYLPPVEFTKRAASSDQNLIKRWYKSWGKVTP